MHSRHEVVSYWCNEDQHHEDDGDQQEEDAKTEPQHSGHHCDDGSEDGGCHSKKQGREQIEQEQRGKGAEETGDGGVFLHAQRGRSQFDRLHGRVGQKTKGEQTSHFFLEKFGRVGRRVESYMLCVCRSLQEVWEGTCWSKCC